MRSVHWLLVPLSLALAGCLVTACGSETRTDATTAVGSDGGRLSSGGTNAGGVPNGGNANGGSAGLGGRGAGGSAGLGGSSGSAPSGGASGASTGSGGAAARDGGSSGGAMSDASVATVMECAGDSSAIVYNFSPSARSRVEGQNGDFVDHCAPNGDLIKYSCEVQYRCAGPGPNPACVPHATGIVRPSLIDCGGRCRGGTCEDRCPGIGETVVYEATDGAGLYVVKNPGDGETYTCTLLFDNDRDTYDCLRDPKVGTEARVDGGSNGTCEAGFALGVVERGTDSGNVSQCTLGCRRGSTKVAAPTGAPPALTACPAAGQDAPDHIQGTPDTAGRTSGANGTFADACTSDGNLIDRSCRLVDKSSPPYLVHSGAVSSTFYDCGGACQAGACMSSCPSNGQTIQFDSSATDSYFIVRNQTEGRRYGCVVYWDDPTDTFDCATGIHAGTTGHAVVTSPSAFLCNATIAELPVSIDGVTSCAGCPQCKLSCRVTP